MTERPPAPERTSVDPARTGLRRFAFIVLFGLSGVSLLAQATVPLTLAEAMRLAVSRNERALIADARLDAAQARVSRARAFFFPDVNLNSTYTRRQYETVRRIDNEDVVIQSLNAFNSTALITGTIFDARAFPLYRQARFDRDSAEFSAEDQKRLVAFEAADAFVSTLGSEQVLAAADRRRDFARASLVDARARLDAGLVSSNDVTKAELEFATAERERSRARGNVQQSYLELGNLLNAEITGPLEPPQTVLTIASRPLQVDQAVIDQAARTRPDIAAAEKSVAALREFAEEPSRRIIPNLRYNGQYRQTNEGGLSGRDGEGSASVVLGWTPFDGGDARAERAERLALVRAAQFQLDASRRRVDLEVRSAVVGLQNEQASFREAVIAADAARRNVEETGELYRQGLAGALEVADANVRRFEADVAESRARYQLALAYLAYRDAIGAPPSSLETDE